MNRQKLTSTLFRCFLTSRRIQSLHLEQNTDVQFSIAKHRKKWLGVLTKNETFVTFLSRGSNFEPDVKKW